jgi:hypothetical protein
MIVKRFSDFRQRVNARGDEKCGPADVYYSRADFARTAAHYGWGAQAQPTNVVDHMGDRVTLFEVLHPQLDVVRVRYL